MIKFAKLKYSELETKKVNDFETSFVLQPLERGYGNTLGNAIRRVLLSSISGVAPFAIKISGVQHEFQTINGVSEDVVQMILNIKDVRFVFNRDTFSENEIVKIELKSKKGAIHAQDLKLPAGIELVNPKAYIATTSKVIEMEIFLTSGRGFRSFEENKSFIKDVASNLETQITDGAIIAVDSDFSPVVNVSYDSVELNSSSSIIEEKLTINVKTDGSVQSKDAISEASKILIGHLETIADVSNLEHEVSFEENSNSEAKQQNKSIPISMLDLSVRSYNCLKRAGYETLESLSKLNRKELEDIKHLGKKSVEEILSKLEERGVSLKEGE